MKTKYLVLITDGMADYPLEEISGKTPLEEAKTKNLDFLAKKSIVGLVKTVSDDLYPGSDIANLSILGYNPKVYYTGRAPLEAFGRNIKLNKTDVAYRCNLVYIENNIMKDFSANHISSEEAKELILALNENLLDENIKFYSGVSYRNLMIWKNGEENIKTTPPHDIQGENIKKFLPEGEKAEILISIMEKAKEILKNHPVNLKRISENKYPANYIWLWGQGKTPNFPSFKEKYNLSGVIISAVDLVKGLGKALGLDLIEVEGATGFIDTNYEGKIEAAISALKRGYDFALVHVEAPDECGHIGDLFLKIKAIEDIDKRIVKKIINSINFFERIKVLILPDHPTPIKIRTHTNDPVPFLIYDSKNEKENKINTFCEKEAKALGVFINSGEDLMKIFIENE